MARVLMLSSALVAALALLAAEPAYRSVSLDQSGQLHIVLTSGKEISPHKARAQVAFGDPKISPDRRTAGWLVMYRGELAGGLALYRAGRVLHTFTTEQVFWDWQFQDGGERVAYSTGPTHGGAAECVLRDVESGRAIARWPVRSGAAPPEWARNLRR